MCALEASQQNLLMGGTWGKGKQREEAEMAPGVSNREGAIISDLITIDHQLLARARSEGGGKRGVWLEEEEEGLAQTCFEDT